MVATYIDDACSTDHCTGYVFQLDNGKYRMLYMGHSKKFKGLKLFAAISNDGVHFSPEEIYSTKTNPEKMFSHEVMSLPVGWEIAHIYEDKLSANPKERYKLLMAELYENERSMKDTVYISENLLDWTIKQDISWANGAEPLASVFYNKQKKTYTIIERPFWGIRSVGFKETKDWENFSEFNYCLEADSNDERLAEIYGMYAFEYDGMYIGVPHIYHHLKSELNAKYKNGIIDTQLAYSYDGRYWKRSLREPFISGLSFDKDSGITKHNLSWVTNMQKLSDENIYLYGSASELEHGPAFHESETGKIFVYKMRKDGFISLVTENKKEPSVIATREKVWHGGELHFNIKAKKATVAVYISDEGDTVVGNLLGFSRLIDGFSHEDCIEFSGNCLDWIPQYKSGKKISDLIGKTLVFELKFEDGEVYSLCGDYTDVSNTQAARYRKFGVLPE